MRKFFATMLITASCACSSLKKDNDPVNPQIPVSEQVSMRVNLYRAEGKKYFDSKGLYHHKGSVGDSALFSCLAYAGGVTTFDPSVFFTPEGKPLRHPDITPKDANAPISKDMVSGLLWCMYKLGKTDPQKALGLINKMIDYGRDHHVAGNWNFCSDEDVKVYGINSTTLAGKCIMTPAVMKDVHRVAKWLGRPCDDRCKLAMSLGVDIPNTPDGFEGHLAVIGTTRNGLVEGALNDNSLKQLKTMADRNPNNGLYSAAYERFKSGNQERTWEILTNPKYFPADRVADNTNYCTDYLFQRDELKDARLAVDTLGCVDYLDPGSAAPIRECELLSESDGAPLAQGDSVSRVIYNDDWLPCERDPLEPKTMTDWLFAYVIASGEI